MIKINNHIKNNIIEVNILVEQEVPFPPIIIETDGDVTLDELVAKLIDLAKYEKPVDYNFVDDEHSAEQQPKINIVKETLEEIYKSYNSSLTAHLLDSDQNIVP